MTKVNHDRPTLYEFLSTSECPQVQENSTAITATIETADNDRLMGFGASFKLVSEYQANGTGAHDLYAVTPAQERDRIKHPSDTATRTITETRESADQDAMQISTLMMSSN